MVILQSSAAVGLLVAGFAGNATLGFGEGLAKTLGADLGSALLIQVLSFPLGLAGAFAAGNGGRDVLPVHGSQCETGGADHFGDRVYPDFLTVFARNHGPDPRKQFPARIGDISGARLRYGLHCRRILALVMHSSLAVILMCVTLVSLNAVSVKAGVSLVLGANLGSSIIPVWLSRAMAPES